MPVDDEAPTGPPITKVWKRLKKNERSTTFISFGRPFYLGQPRLMQGGGQNANATAHRRKHQKAPGLQRRTSAQRDGGHYPAR
jgi:hypothetical protein